MSRDLTPAQQEAVESRTTAPRWLLEIEFDSGTTRLWTGFGILEALGHEWIGAGRLGTIETIQETLDTVARGLSMSLTIIPTEEIPDAPDVFLNAALTEEYQGRPVTVYQAMMDINTLELIDQPFVRFRGHLDVMEDVEMPGASQLRLTAENRLIDLDRARKRTYTPEDQKSVDESDTFFDEVAMLQNREIVLE